MTNLNNFTWYKTGTSFNAAGIAEKLFKQLLWIRPKYSLSYINSIIPNMFSYIFNFWKEHGPFFTDYGEVFLATLRVRVPIKLTKIYTESFLVHTILVSVQEVMLK